MALVVSLIALLMWIALPAGHAQAIPENLVSRARVSASSQASPADGKYGVLRLADGNRATHWASANKALPQWIRIEWDQAQEFDTISLQIYHTQARNLYAGWKRFEVELSDGTKRAYTVQPDQDVVNARLEKPCRAKWVQITLLEVYEERTYVGVDEVGIYLDPERRIREPKPIARALPREAIRVLGGRPHPSVYVTAADVARARRNAEQTEWGRQTKQEILAAADKWLERTEEEWLRFLPPPGACYAYGFTGCPICRSSWGTWGGARCSWDRPGTVQCTQGHILPDAKHPDDGSGYKGPDGRVHYFVGSWNAWVTEQWLNAINRLGHAYALTGDERYAERAAFFLDALASIYAESTSGSWDYPSSPPSGRFARPWYQVARTLVPFVEGYDLIYTSKALDKPSLRPRLEKGFPKGPTLQQRVVGTPDARGKSWDGMTRRDNIDVNLMQDGAYYCYSHSFSGMLHNGHADYMRGALAVGVLLGIPTYVYNAVESPYSIYAMLANNCDRDGRYYETALGYAIHCRDLYLTFTEPLRHWSDERYPKGVNLFANDRFRAFYELPDLTMDIAGHALNYGDCSPDHAFVFSSDDKFSQTDYAFAERLYAGCTGAERERFARLVRYLAGGDVERARAAASNRIWLLYHADPVPGNEKPSLPEDLHRKVFGSWFLGQKGLAILRDGSGAEAQGALVRFGPSLNHGHLDDLGLIYYAKGWQCTYEIGYGLGSTHTQVGWARQTASHCLVTVDEARQSGGSGGSLHLFARLPGIKIVEADSPLSYAANGVTQYRRTVALIGEGKDQYLVDLFRVRGGRQHDYILGSQGQEFEVSGVELGPEEKGSLAGLEHAWGEKLGNDGDIIGMPNKPYWNPPPGNGYGFFYGMRRGRAAGPWWVDWALGGPNQARFRAHVLPEASAEAIVARAPGLYPRNRNASYLLLRRTGENLQSCFATVLEPYALPMPSGMADYTRLLRSVTANQGAVVPMHSLAALLLRGTAPGDYVECALSVPTAGEYEVQARLYRYSSYGAVRLSVDGTPIGEIYDAVASSLEGPVTVRFGRRRLAAGEHRVKVEITNASPRTLIGIAGLGLVPAVEAERESAKPEPILSGVERLPVAGGLVRASGDESGFFPPAAVRVRRGGRDEFFASQAPLIGRPGEVAPENSFQTPVGPAEWSGGAVHVALRGREVAALALHGTKWLQVGGLRIEPVAAAFYGSVTRADAGGNAVDVSGSLPLAGLEGEGILFMSPRYTRNTAYRIERIEKAGSGSRVHFGTQSILLGQGRIADWVDKQTLTSEIPHDYARSVVGGTNNGFFNGKRVESESGTTTFLKDVEFGTPMRLAVEDASRFEAGSVVYYYDLSVGDTYSIPTAVWLSRTEAGTWRLVSSVDVRLNGSVRYRKPGGAWTVARDGLVPATGMEASLEVEWKPAGAAR
ncbi:MAG TPA: discoidin domain-containing protein [Armatimonadota bacterium]|jgi:hypothetical protein|nr:discoidin domain-containing protein [Armatimonadota bacterium]